MELTHLTYLRKWNMSVEVLVFIMFMNVDLTESALKNIFSHRVCHQILEYDKLICENLGQFPFVEEQTKPVLAALNVARTFTICVVPAYFNLFLGPWSDKHGRKALIVLPLLGYRIFCYLICMFSLFPNVNVWLIVGSYLLVGVTGGRTVMWTGILCYVSDSVPPKDRAIRLGILEGFRLLGSLFGQLLSEPLFKQIGSNGVFMVAGVGYSMAAVFAICLIEETVKVDSGHTWIEDILSFKHLSDVLTALSKPRLNNFRYKICILLITMSVAFFVIEGSFITDNLFLRYRFAWGLDGFAIFSSMKYLVQITGSMAGVYFLNRICNFSEVAISIISLIFVIIVASLESLAKTGWQLHYTIPLTFFEKINCPMMQAYLSKTVSENETGKIFAMALSIQALIPLLVRPLYGYLFQSTLGSYYGTCYVLSAGLSLLNLLLLLTLLGEDDPVIAIH